MDGNVYNYAAANMWNSYSESFQPPALDLQSYMQPSREHFPREQNKNPLGPSSSYVFLNYPEEAQHHHHHHPQVHHHENINRGQWHFPAWPKVKPRSDQMPHALPKRPLEKHFNKEADLGMALMHATPSLNLPPPGGFCAPDITDRILEDVHRFVPSIDDQDSLNSANSNTAANPSCLQVPPQPAPSARNVSRKNPVPRKRKERSKRDDKPKKKRTRDEETWARNIRKKARAKGEAYVSVMGKPIKARSVQPVDCSKCKFNCPLRVSEEDRKVLFEKYWNLESYKEKVEFISGCVHEFTPLRPVSGRRAYSRRYMLKVRGKDERVCKEFFVSTFDISESTIVTYMSKKRKGPDAIADLRGKQTPSNKTSSEVVRTIREHILSQIGLQGELSRTPSEDAKNVKKLYAHFHAECEADGKKPASISVYRKVYSDMHMGKTDPPVEIPPEDILLLSNNKKKTKPTKEDNSSSHPPEPASSPELDSPNPIPSGSEDINVSPTETASPFDLGLIPTPYHPGSADLHPMGSHMEKRMCTLNIPHTVNQQQPEHQQHQQQHQHQQQNMKALYNTPFQPDFVSPMVEKSSHINPILPFMWDTGRIGNQSIPSDCPNLGYPPTMFPPQSHTSQPSSSALSSSLFNYRISTPSSSSTAPPPQPSTSNFDVETKIYQLPVPFQGSLSSKPQKSSGSSVNRSRKPKESKPKKEPKKRSRNEELWGRNIRKRLRFKGEAYTSVKGKLVEAKKVREVDCSKCKFKCTSRITEEERLEFNKEYWHKDTYKKKIEFITTHVQTYTPKRKMTGRRAFSRKYLFAIKGREERVCKDFFKATLHVSESTIATALEKARKGEEAIVDMRGKHKPVNKTTEDTLQNIRELIIYLTGMRPHRASNNNFLNPENRDVNRLYQVYKYDCEKKDKRVASLGIFRGVLSKDFCIKSAAVPKKKKKTTRVAEEGPYQEKQDGHPDSGPVFPVMLFGSMNSLSTRNDLSTAPTSGHQPMPGTSSEATESQVSPFADLNIPVPRPSV
ncbi:uncharacterized protein LOC101854391 isoform X2 [Aplysia californica]|uniref:Uncharacterized protein LOC101854391 isoform X2 n=1 Tax=Aplysia californica TaxID=6500 RepID=A0ABM0JF39_APLCA|nr:uncharacterized protein LOC101854391 isoform X2 [Aplysia californica]